MSKKIIELIKNIHPFCSGLPRLAGSKRIRWVDTETNRSFFSIAFSIILLSLNISPVMAQEATGSSEIAPTLIPILDNLNNSNENQSLSATLKKSLELLPFTRNNYNLNQKIETRIQNYSSDDNLVLTLKNKNNFQIPINKSEDTATQELLLKLDPPRVFAPGRYELEATDLKELNLKQEFNLGILNINTDKSVYNQGDQAKIGISLSDEKGVPVCSGHLELKVEFPKDELGKPQTQIFKTMDRSIKVNPACQKHQNSSDPDYLAILNLNHIGTYNLELKAQTKNGEYSTTDKIEVRDNSSFSLQRQSPHRIYSPEKSQVTIKFTPSADFKGQVIETVPQELTIIPPEAGQKYDSVKILAIENKYSPPGAVISPYNPFTGSFRETLAFGQNVTDPFLKRQYLAFGNIGHDGVDFALPEGTPVIAAEEGMVIHAEYGPYGNTIIIKHSWGQSYYGHLSKFKVENNQYISKGELIGLSGKTGLSTGPHLHFGLRLNNYDINNGYFGKIDPLLYLNSENIYSENAIKQITWNVNLKKGESVDLGYMFKAPDISSRAYLTGPLKVFSSNINQGLDFSQYSETKTEIITSEVPEIVFEENRYWQLLADSTNVKLIDLTTGSTEDLDRQTITEVTTNNKVVPSSDLYLAAVSVSPNITIDKVEGLGLTWKKLSPVCQSNSSTATALFWAKGAPVEDDFVKAKFNNDIPFKGAAAIGIFRYSGVDPVEPVGRSFCDSLQEKSPSFSINNFSTNQENSVVFVALGHHSPSFTPGALYTSNSEIRTGNNENSLVLSAEYQALLKPVSDLEINGDFDKETDWSIATVEIIADQNKPKNMMRHGQWINNQGAKQPLTF